MNRITEDQHHLITVGTVIRREAHSWSAAKHGELCTVVEIFDPTPKLALAVINERGVKFPIHWDELDRYSLVFTNEDELFLHNLY